MSSFTLDDLIIKLEDDKENLDTLVRKEDEVWFCPAFESPINYLQKLTGDAVIPVGKNYKFKQGKDMILEIGAYSCVAKRTK